MFSLPYTYQVEVLKNKKKKTEILNKSENFYFEIEKVSSLPFLGDINISNYLRTIPIYQGHSLPVMPAMFLLELFSDYSVNRLIKEMETDSFTSFPKLFDDYIIKKDDDFDNVKEIKNDNKNYIENKVKKIAENIIYINEKLYVPCPELYLVIQKHRGAGSNQTVTKHLNFENNIKSMYSKFFVSRFSVHKGAIYIPVNQIPRFNFMSLPEVENFNSDCFSLMKKSNNEDIKLISDFFHNLSDSISLSLITKDFVESLVQYYELKDSIDDRNFIENCFLYSNALKKINEKLNKTSDIFHIIDNIITSLDLILNYSEEY